MRLACQERIVPLGMRAKHGIAAATLVGPSVLLDAWPTDPCTYLFRRLNDAHRMEVGSGELCMALQRQDHREICVRVEPFIHPVVVIAAVIDDGGEGVTCAAS